MKSQDSTSTGLLALESFGSQIQILNLLISTNSSSVVSYQNKQGGAYFQECVPLSEELYLFYECQGCSDSGRSLSRESNVLADSLFIRDRMIQIERVLNEF